MPSSTRTFAVVSICLVAVILGPATSAAQPQAPRPETPRALTTADYARAERFLGPNVSPLVVGGSVAANWLADDRFWYRNQVADGFEFILVTPATRTRRPLFDHARLASALSKAAGASYTARTLPFQALDIPPDLAKVSFDLNGRRWTCDVLGASCADTGAALGRGATGSRGAGRGGTGGGRGGGVGPAVPSPDGKLAAFIRNWNLWVRDEASGQER